MRSTIINRRHSNRTPSQLEDLRHIHALLTSDEPHRGTEDQLREINYRWRSLEVVLKEDPFQSSTWQDMEMGVDDPSTSDHYDLDSRRSSFLDSSFSCVSPGPARNRLSSGINCLINPHIDETIEAISIMTVHEIASTIYGPVHSQPSNMDVSWESQAPEIASTLTRQGFEDLWNVLEETGLRDFEQSILYVHRVPEHWEVSGFLRYLYSVTRFSPECFVIAMVYVSRILTNPFNITLTSLTWRPLFFSCCMLAHKYWDDDYLANQDFVQGYPVHTGFEANRLERSVLKLLNYRMGVLPSVYARSYFGLRAATILKHEKRYQQLERNSRTSTPDYRKTIDSNRSSLSTSAGSPSCFEEDMCSSAFHKMEHTELRRSLLHIIHGEECSCQLHSVPSYETTRISMCRSVSKNDEHKVLEMPRERKRLWTYSVHQAGQLLRRFMYPTRMTGSRQTATDGSQNHNNQLRRHSCMLPQPCTFDRSIITMAIHPYLHHHNHHRHKPGQMGNRKRENPSRVSGTQGCPIDRGGGCFEDVLTSNVVSETVDPMSSRVAPPLASAPPCSAPAALFRRSLSFESLPTLKKGLQVYDEDSQPPIIGHETPLLRSNSGMTLDDDDDDRWDPYERESDLMQNPNALMMSPTPDCLLSISQYHNDSPHSINCRPSYHLEHPCYETICWDQRLMGKYDIE